MGWIFEDRRGRSVEEYIEQVYEGTEWKSKPVVKISGYANERVYYRAFKSVNSGEILCAVILVHAGKYEIGYKAQDETMGPLDCECPESILKVLSPTDNEWANEWRAKCRAKNERDKKLKEGVKIKFERNFEFHNGSSTDTFRLVLVTGRSGRKQTRLKALCEDGKSFLAHIPNWKKYNFKIIE